MVSAESGRRKSLALYGAYTPAIGQLGVALVAANQPTEAASVFQRAIALDPNNADNYAYLGIALGKQNQCASAISYFEQSLKIDSSNAVAQKGMGDCKAGKEPSVPASAPPAIPLVPPALPK